MHIQTREKFVSIQGKQIQKQKLKPEYYCGGALRSHEIKNKSLPQKPVQSYPTQKPDYE